MNVTRESSNRTSWGVIIDLTKVIKGALNQDGIDLLSGGKDANIVTGKGERNELYERNQSDRFSPEGRKVLWVSFEPPEPTPELLPILRVKVTVREEVLMENSGHRKKIDSILAIISKAVETELAKPTANEIKRVHPTKIMVKFDGIHVLI